ncbi:hypothetical protein [uncultured Lutibacter sp.]|nr:hypothetical protein [uncultured Lutibacter sp.]
METIKKDENKSSTFIKEFALKNYKTYVAHYESRKLQPMPFNDFLKNYTS